MRLSIRTHMLAIVLPLSLVTLALSAVLVTDLIGVRQEISAFHDGVLRSVHAQRYVRQLHGLLGAATAELSEASPDDGAIDSARAELAATLDRLRPLAPERAPRGAAATILTREALAEWEQTQEQVDIYIGRALALARQGDVAQARRLMVDELDVLLESRILASVDRVTAGEQALVEEHRVRVARATGHWLAASVGSLDLDTRL
ncbi:MAG: hypothetical protein ACR2P8_08820, partial [Myxococcota bacterium]